MRALRAIASSSLISMLLGASASASELSYTFIDFQAIADKSVGTSGAQSPVPSQTVSIVTDKGDGIAVGGSVTIGERFYVGGSYQSSIVDVMTSITNPLGTTDVQDNFDLILTRVSAGYVHPIGETFDLVFDVSYDTAHYDFGSLAGENFDIEDAGSGAQFGFRWNPRLDFEVYSFARYSSMGKADLNRREFEPASYARVGFLWYFFEDLGLGVDYESGEVDTTTISMRFNFGDLRLQR